MVNFVACNQCSQKMDVAKNGAVAELGHSYFNGDAYKCPTCGISVFVTDTQGSTNFEAPDLVVKATITRLIQLANQLDSKGFIREASMLDNLVDNLVNKFRGKKPETKVLQYDIHPKEIEDIKKIVTENNDQKLISFLNQMISDRILKFSYSLGYI